MHARLRDQAPKIGHTDKAALQSPISLMPAAQTKYLGDGVVIYFVYPQAHEGDGERAERAGLEWSRRWQRSKASVSLQTRVGVATGLIVVGEGSGIRG